MLLIPDILLAHAGWGTYFGGRTDAGNLRPAKFNQKRTMKKQYGRLVAFLFFLTCATFSASLYAQADVDPPEPEDIKANTNIKVVPPTNTLYGTRGLSQTASAEALGEGRLIFGIRGAGYQQQREFVGGPNLDANILTGVGAVSFGLSPYVDGFASMSGFGSTGYEHSPGSGLGSVGGGFQGTLPFEPSAPIRMAAQIGIFQGLSDNPINSNNADGYNYLETRTGLDFTANLIQTLVFGNENNAFKFHVNEGMVTSAESGRDALLLMAVGVQFNANTTVLGLEAHSRTPFNDIAPGTDPLWMTPSLQFRTAYNINATVGADVALSQDRDNTNVRGLEPFRLFAGMAFTFDTQSGKRRDAKEKAQLELMRKAELEKKNRKLSKSLVEQAREDSLAQAALKAQNDSATTAMSGKSRQDSLTMAEKARQDSLSLETARKSLEDEKSKRSESEKQLLSTGMLLLDAVYFETGKTEISINSKPYLNIIGKMLTKYPKLQIEVAGHTDDVGSDASNQRLSQGRAQAVETYMAQTAPDLQGRLSARGYGESMAKAENTSAEGRKLNRRTELQVKNKEALAEYNH